MRSHGGTLTGFTAMIRHGIISAQRVGVPKLASTVRRAALSWAVVALLKRLAVASFAVRFMRWTWPSTQGWFS